jgi:hypothetical protein
MFFLDAMLTNSSGLTNDSLIWGLLAVCNYGVDPSAREFPAVTNQELKMMVEIQCRAPVCWCLDAHWLTGDGPVPNLWVVQNTFFHTVDTRCALD